MRHPVAVFVPTLGVPAPARAAVPPRSVQRPGRHDPAARRAVAGGLRPARRGSSERAGSRPLSLAIRTTGPATRPANVAALYDYSRRLAADPRIVRVDGFVDVDPRLTRDQYHAAVRRAGRAARPLRGDRAGGDDQGRPDDVHADHAVRPERRRGARGWSRTCARATARWPPPAGTTVLVGGGAADVVDVVDGIGAGLPPDRAVHLRVDLPRPVRPAAIGRPAGQGAGR